MDVNTMFELFDKKDANKFTWESIGDIVGERKILGEDMPVYVYRLFQFTLRDELADRFGSDVAADIFRNAGELAGKEFAKHLLDLELPFNKFIAHLQGVLADSKIGVLRVEEFDAETGDATLTIAEDLDCSGLPVTGEVVCSYDEGFLAGILKTYTKKDYKVIEIDCWATGARVCRFRATIKKESDKNCE